MAERKSKKEIAKQTRHNHQHAVTKVSTKNCPKLTRFDRKEHLGWKVGDNGFGTTF